jgi:hypothetical protein
MRMRWFIPGPWSGAGLIFLLMAIAISVHAAEIKERKIIEVFGDHEITQEDCGNAIRVLAPLTIYVTSSSIEDKCDVSILSEISGKVSIIAPKEQREEDLRGQFSMGFITKENGKLYIYGDLK